MAYEFLAGCYDAFTADVHYARWADYLEKHFARSRLPIRTVLDLACGTGSLTRVLAERGYEMIGADLSQEMLAQAAEKCRGAGPIEPIFLHQAMEELDLYGTIDACVCCLDSINVRHTGPGDAVCGSYRNSEGCGNVATDNQSASPETEIHCDDRGCRHLEGRCCCADHVSIDECSCGPECATRAPRETAE